MGRHRLAAGAATFAVDFRRQYSILQNTCRLKQILRKLPRKMILHDIENFFRVKFFLTIRNIILSCVSSNTFWHIYVITHIDVTGEETLMQKPFLVGINPFLFSPRFAFSYEGAQHYISHNAFQGSRNSSNIIIKFPDFQSSILFKEKKTHPFR